MHGKGKIVLEVSKTLSRKMQLWINRIENGRISAFSALNAFAKEVKLICAALANSFLSALPHLSEMHRYIPCHIYIKNMRSPFEVPELQVHWEGLHCWTADWTAMSTAVECLTQFWVDVQTMKPKLSICAGRQKSFFSFSNYIPLWSYFSTI